MLWSGDIFRIQSRVMQTIHLFFLQKIFKDTKVFLSFWGILTEDPENCQEYAFIDKIDSVPNPRFEFSKLL